jgi:hypothetical protein
MTDPATKAAERIVPPHFTQESWQREVNRAASIIREAMAEEMQAYGNVLAVLNSDGGQRQQEVGIRQAAEEGIAWHNELRAKLAKAEAALDEIESLRRRFPASDYGDALRDIEPIARVALAEIRANAADALPQPPAPSQSPRSDPVTD